MSSWWADAYQLDRSILPWIMKQVVFTSLQNIYEISLYQ